MYNIIIKRTNANTMVTIATIATNDALTMGYDLGRHYADIASYITQQSDHESVVSVKFNNMDDEDTRNIIQVLTDIADRHWGDADYRLVHRNLYIGLEFYEIVVGEELFSEAPNPHEIDIEILR